MKYRTMIELICNASDKDEAFHTAGEYLRGDIDSGVRMKCKTRPLGIHRTVKGAMISLAVLFCFSALLLNVSVLEKGAQDSAVKFRIAETCTVQPELKTKAGVEFQEAWKTKKDEAVLEYIKN